MKRRKKQRKKMALKEKKGKIKNKRKRKKEASWRLYAKEWMMWVCEIKRKSWKAFEQYKNEQMSHLNPQLTRSFHSHYPQPHYNLIKSYLILSGLVLRFRQWEDIQKHSRLVKLEYFPERLMFFHFSVFSHKNTWGTWIWLQLFFMARM